MTSARGSSLQQSEQTEALLIKRTGRKSGNNALQKGNPDCVLQVLP
ncbi:MAG: hypothetical protein PHO94_11755 [Petrimonas sp.]|nr:hypothetical protein [Petrimonas sp.]